MLDLMRHRDLLAALALTVAACGHRGSAPQPTAHSSGAPTTGGLVRAGERHLRNVRQLTFGGENAEAYFSFDGRRLVFQATHEGRDCDQEYVMGIDGSEPRMVSTGKGRVTCGYFLPGDEQLLYASTHHLDPACPPKPDLSQGYVWKLDDFDLFVARADGSDATAPRPLAPAPGYDAEATVSRDGWIVFTSTRDGDLDLYKVRVDGSELTRLTDEPGYDGGAFFSADGKRIVYRASRPAPGPELDGYRALLARKLVRPGKLEIWVMDADGKNRRQVTALGAASFAPFFHPDGKRIVFASNVGDPKGRNFDLYLVNDDGSGLERVTTEETFDGFPMFSPDGKKLVFGSNRNAARPGETNVFVADWVE
jgi:Tol biopolymer transport system component